VRSLALAQELVRLTDGTDPALLATLAAAYAETGNFADAVTTTSKARELAVKRGDAQLEATLAAQGESYRAGRPFRDINLRNTQTSNGAQGAVSGAATNASNSPNGSGLLIH
jgi:hypothetical protein